MQFKWQNFCELLLLRDIYFLPLVALLDHLKYPVMVKFSVDYYAFCGIMKDCVHYLSDKSIILLQWMLCLTKLTLTNSMLISIVHSVEYAFGAHDYSTSGVFEVEPRQCPGFKFRKSIFMGTTCLDPLQVREFMEQISANYNGDTYHLIVKNCNHFCKDVCYKLTGNQIPKWVNRLARLGIS